LRGIERASSIAELRVGCAASPWVAAGFREVCEVTTPLDDAQTFAPDADIDLLVVDAHWMRESGRAYQQLVESSRSRGVPTAYWYTVDASWHDELVPPAAGFDLVFSADPDSVAPLTAVLPSGRRAILLPAAARNPPTPVAPTGDRAIELAYVGGPVNSVVATWLRPLLPLGLQVFVSDELQTAKPSERAEDIPVTSELDAIAALDRLGEIRLAVCVDPELESEEMRTVTVYEALARGGHPIVKFRRGHLARALHEGVTIARDPADLEATVAHLLAEGAPADVVNTGRRLVANQHTYAHRLATIVSAAGGALLPVA
jgi:hypothetical protein